MFGVIIDSATGSFRKKLMHSDAIFGTISAGLSESDFRAAHHSENGPYAPSSLRAPCGVGSLETTGLRSPLCSPDFSKT
jgi:hypothetical protein